MKKKRKLSVKQRRNLLRGLKWHDFADAYMEKFVHKGHLFKAGFDWHLGQPALAVINRGEFIVIRYLPTARQFAEIHFWNNNKRSTLVGDLKKPNLGHIISNAFDYGVNKDDYVVGPKIRRGCK